MVCYVTGCAFHGQLTWPAVPLAPVQKGGGGGVCGHVRCGPRGQDQEVGDLAAFLWPGLLAGLRTPQKHVTPSPGHAPSF